MNVEYFISKRIVTAKENKNVFSRPIIRITISAIALSVAVMLISLSVLDGFQSEISEKIVSLGSHIQISSVQKSDSYTQTPLRITDSLTKTIHNNPEIISSEKVIHDFGLVKTKDDFLGINLKGVSSSYTNMMMKNYIKEGVIASSDSSILVSENIANKLKLSVSDKINVYFPSKNKDKIKVRPFWVSGIFSTSMSEFDETLAFVNLEKLQKIKGWKTDEFSVLELKVNNFESVNKISEELSISLPDFYNKRVSSIKELYPQIFDWLKLQDMNVLIIIILMLVVSVVNIVSSLLILILEKTKFIGILKSFGTTNWSIRKVFLYNSMYLVTKGLLWGNTIAFSLLFIQYKFQIIKLDEATYYMSTIPVSFNFNDFIFLNIFTLLVCLLMMILPTIVITKISAVKAIRFQ